MQAENQLTFLYAKLILVQLFWSGVFIAGQLAILDQPPLLTAFIRNLLTAICFVGILWWQDRKTLKLPPKSTYFMLTVMGFFGVFLYNTLVYIGLRTTTALSASLLIPTIQPLTTVFLSSRINKEPLNKDQLVGLLLGLAGAAAILTGEWALNTTFKDMLGNLLIVSAAVCFSIYSVCGKIVLNKIGPLEATTYSSITGTIFLVPFIFISNDFSSLAHASNLFWMCMGYLVIFAGVIPYLWWYSAVKVIGAGKTGSITFLMPPFALILSYLFLGQVPSLLQIAGGLSGLLGVAFASGLFSQFKRHRNAM